jgi:Holliday junction DNA helicase RuvA
MLFCLGSAMLSYLKGTVAGVYKLSSTRVLLIVETYGIGYEVQILPRLLPNLVPVGEPIQLFTHLHLREDQVTLFGFAGAAERDLFRQLISVNGIGPQLAIALLDTLGLSDLVQAIVSGQTRQLTRTPGVGTKTAERIALELKTKLAEWREQAGLMTTPAAGPVAAIQEDVEMTLLALGYSNREITQALQAVGENTSLAKSGQVEDWIREAIAWLSQ